MSLYIRLSTNFFSHVKTLRLRAAIGNDALWIPPRLWVYAAEHRPDGNLSDFTADELAMLVGYSGDAQALLKALLKACFLDADPLRIHGWAEHNGFHQAFADRASKAAKARWKRQEKTGDEKTRHEMSQALLLASPSNASSMKTHAEAVYQAYPKKIGKPVALRAILKAMQKVEPAMLLERTKAFAVAQIGGDPQYCPHPATWFNQERYNDDPSTWVRVNTNERTRDEGHSERRNSVIYH